MQHPPSVRVYANCNYLTGLVNTVLVWSLMNFQQPALEILFTCSNLTLILSKLLSVETYVFTSAEMDRGCSLWAQISQTGHIQAVILTNVLCSPRPFIHHTCRASATPSYPFRLRYKVGWRDHWSGWLIRDSDRGVHVVARFTNYLVGNHPEPIAASLW